METPRTYVPYKDWKAPSQQTEYTEATPLLNKDGTLNAKGWARHNVFDYDRTLVKKGSPMSKKEWDFYQISDGKYMLQLSFANIGIGGYVAAKLINLLEGKTVADATQLYLGGKKHLPPPKGDVPNRYKDKIGSAEFDFDTKVTYRTLKFKKPYKGKMVECDFTMDIPHDLENITTVLPFEGDNTKYFMTTKQNCMPCEGTFKWGDSCYTFKKEDSFCALERGRVNTPHIWFGPGVTAHSTSPTKRAKSTFSALKSPGQSATKATQPKQLFSTTARLTSSALLTLRFSRRTTNLWTIGSSFQRTADSILL